MFQFKCLIFIFKGNWNEVRKQLSIVIYAINSACTILQPADKLDRL
jgi:hypothetical protein